MFVERACWNIPSTLHWQGNIMFLHSNIFTKLISALQYFKEIKAVSSIHPSIPLLLIGLWASWCLSPVVNPATEKSLSGSVGCLDSENILPSTESWEIFSHALYTNAPYQTQYSLGVSNKTLKRLYFLTPDSPTIKKISSRTSEI